MAIAMVIVNRLLSLHQSSEDEFLFKIRFGLNVPMLRNSAMHFANILFIDWNFLYQCQFILVVYSEFGKTFIHLEKFSNH